jgi:hypothetical protein
MTELERELALLGREVQYPPTPGLAEAVAHRLGAGAVPRGRGTPPRRVVAIATAIVLFLAGVAAAAVPSARNGVLDLIGLRGATVERDLLPVPAPLMTRLDLGEPTSLAAARRLVAFRPAVPIRLGEPDEVFVRRPPGGGELSLVYRPRPGLPRLYRLRPAARQFPGPRVDGVGLLVGEFRGDLVPDLIGKLVGPKTRLDRLTVGGEPAVWISGAPHQVFYRGPGGRIRAGTVRLAANVLLLERGRLLIRLEGAFGKQTAIAIARSLR